MATTAVCISYLYILDRLPAISQASQQSSVTHRRWNPCYALRGTRSNPVRLRCRRVKEYFVVLVPLFHPPALATERPERQEVRRFVVALVMRTHHLLHRLRRLLRMVERNPGRVVVQDVRLGRTVEHMMANEAEAPVNGRRRTPHEVPGLVGEIRQRYVAMLEEGDDHCQG